ncbi:hypothetical protein [Bradyrhizobium lupini]|uniref:hypothetical protein n=1 Tax=Rhizobium lupini TaxID=136996 RepID=UPI0034C60816
MTTTTISRPSRPAGTTIRRRSDIDDKAADRDKLAAFAATIGAAKTSLKRDTCGDWTITGLTGHISTDGAALHAYVGFTSARAWTTTKQKLCFMAVTQDGDTEGVLMLHRPLTPGQAETLRTALRIRKTRPMSDRTLEALTVARQRSERSPCYEAG